MVYRRRKPKAVSTWCEELECEIEVPQLTVYEYDCEPTGLLDKNGFELVRDDRVPMGFTRT